MASDKIKIAMEQDTNARPIEISVMQDDCEVISATVLTGYTSDVPGDIVARLEAIEALIPSEATPDNQLADKKYVSDAVSAVANSVTELTGRVDDLETCCDDLTQKVATNAGNIAQNASDIAGIKAQQTADKNDIAQLQSDVAANSGAISALESEVDDIQAVIPSQASAENPLADKAFVNSTVQTSTANFRGNWPTYADIPSIPTAYPVDFAGSTTPTPNDYLVVEADENYDGQTWRYKYIGDWATQGKSGWRAEYKVNDTPLTAGQLAALNSGATAENITQITTNKSDISTLSATKADKTEIADMLTATDAAALYETQAAATSTHNSLSGEISTLSGTVALKANTADVEANYATKSALSETATQVVTNTQNITKAMTDIAALETNKQDKLTAGANITIVDNVISSTSGGSGDYVLKTGDTMTGALTIKDDNEVNFATTVPLITLGARFTIFGEKTYTIEAGSSGLIVNGVELTPNQISFMHGGGIIGNYAAPLNCVTTRQLSGATSFDNYNEKIDVPALSGKLALQIDALPTAEAKYNNVIYQYTGETTGDYTNGHFYKCTASGDGYAWEEVAFGSGDGGVSYADLQQVQTELQNAINTKADASAITDMLTKTDAAGIYQTQVSATATNNAQDEKITANTSAISVLTGRVSANETNITTLTSDVGNVQGLIPTQASDTNQLADKAFVNSTIQTATANFRGNWATHADIPSDVSSYPEDYAGSRTPTVNDYLVVESDETHDNQTWRYKYTGNWADQGVSGWVAEYKVNDTPLTAAQLSAVNSGITTEYVGQIDTNRNDISEALGQIAALYTDKQDKLTAGTGIDITDENVVAVENPLPALAGNSGFLTTDGSTASWSGVAAATKTDISDMLTRTNAAQTYLTQAAAKTTYVNTVQYEQTQNAVSALQTGKQDKLTAGDNITIEDGVISATGGVSKDLSDIDAAGKEVCANMAMPDTSRIQELTFPQANQTQYTAASDGYFALSANTGTTKGVFYIGLVYSGTRAGSWFNYTTDGMTQNTTFRVILPVKKGQVVVVWFMFPSGTTGTLSFIPAVGAQ